MSEKYEELARSARCMCGSTGTANWNAAEALFQATCTPYKIMEITEDFDRVTAERDAALASEQIAIGSVARNQLVIKELQQRLTAADEQLDDCGNFQQRQIAVIQEFSQQVGLLKSLLKRCQPHLPGYALALRTDVESALKVDEVEVLKP